MGMPRDSRLSGFLQGAYFHDCHSTRISYHDETALELYLTLASRTPSWINSLMRLRNKIVSKLGLKDLGVLGDFDQSKSITDYHVGDRIGIFTLLSNTPNEVILEDRDKHLDVKLSFFIEQEGEDKAMLHANTVVHVNNSLGKVYMFFITPLHKRIVPSTLKTLSIS